MQTLQMVQRGYFWTEIHAGQFFGLMHVTDIYVFMPRTMKENYAEYAQE